MLLTIRTQFFPVRRSCCLDLLPRKLPLSHQLPPLNDQEHIQTKHQHSVGRMESSQERGASAETCQHYLDQSQHKKHGAQYDHLAGQSRQQSRQWQQQRQ